MSLLKDMPKPMEISARAKIRWMKMMMICCRTIKSPAHAKKRPMPLAIPSRICTTPHMTRSLNSPMTVSNKNVVRMKKKNSTEPP